MKMAYKRFDDLDTDYTYIIILLYIGHFVSHD